MLMSPTSLFSKKTGIIAFPQDWALTRIDLVVEWFVESSTEFTWVMILTPAALWLWQFCCSSVFYFFQNPGHLIIGTLENPGPSLDVALGQLARVCTAEVRDLYGRGVSLFRGLIQKCRKRWFTVGRPPWHAGNAGSIWKPVCEEREKQMKTAKS
jgi:hypothetical protein